MRIARAALHFYEEPPVSGTEGSGTVFFTGCSLRCVYCQNYGISTDASAGHEVSETQLREIFHRLIGEGARNINLVTPSHYLEQLLPVLAAMQEGAGLSMEKTKQVFLTVAMFAHGYASIIANNGLEYDEMLVAKHLEQAWNGAFLAAAREE